MPLAKQLIPVDLGGGLDTKTSPVLVQPGRAAVPGLAGNAGGFLELENCFRQRTGEFVKRYGSTVLAANATGAQASAILGRLGNSLVQLIRAGTTAPASLYSYSQAGGLWIAPVQNAVGSTVTPAPRPLISATFDSTDPDACVANGYTLVANETINAAGAALITPTIIDNTTGKDVTWGAITLQSVERPRCAATGNFLCLFYADTAANSLKVVVYNTASRIATLFTPAAGVLPAANRFMDARARDGGSTIILAYRVAAGGVSFIEFNPSTGANTTGPVNIAGVDANQALGWVEDRFSTGVYYLASAGTTAGVVVRTLSTAFAATATNTMDGTATANVRNVTGFLTTAGANMSVFWEVSAANAWDFLVRMALWTGAAAVSVFNRSVGLVSKPFTYRSNYYLVVAYESPTQATHFVVSATPRLSGFCEIEAPIAYGSAGGHTNKASLLASVPVSSQTATTAMASRVQITASNGIFRSLRNIQPLELRFDEAVTGTPREMGGAMFYAGGQLRSFDGNTYAEARPPIAPEAPVVTNTGAGNLTALAVYNWVAVYRYADLTGRVYRSSPAQVVQLTGGGANFATSVAIPTLRLGARCLGGLGASYVTVELYRTLANGTTYYLVGSIQNNGAADTVTIVDNNADATLAPTNATGNELVYTTGGVLDDFDAPAFVALEVFGGRLWGINSEDRTRVSYSKELLPGLGVAFRPDTYIRLDQADGDVFALGILDDKLIFFKRSTIYSLSGPGPNALGQGGYDTPTLITNAQGCINPRSVVVTPDGVMFEAQRGIWLLDRSGALQYIGAGVDTYFTGAGQDISAAAHLPWRTQVRFFTTSGRTLVYDYQARQWGTFTGQPASSAVTIGTTLYWCHPTTDIVSQEVEGSYGDNGTGYAQKITTPHLAFGGIAGFQRVYASLLVGENVGTHTLSVAVELNYSGSAAFTRTLAGATAWPRPEVRWDVQRCEAGKLTIAESAANVNAGFKLSALSLLVGVMPNSSRRPATGRLT